MTINQYLGRVHFHPPFASLIQKLILAAVYQKSFIKQYFCNVQLNLTGI